MIGTGYETLWLFLIYSFAGWCLEEIMAALKRSRLVNRGFLNAPFCLLYGFSGLAFRFFLPELADRPVFLFLGGMILASFLEYVTGRMMERLFGRKWWDYSNHRFQLDGYICLEFSLLWGLMAVLQIRLIDPLLIRLIGLIPHLIGRILLWIIFAVLAADLGGTCAALWDMHHNIERLYQFEADLQQFSQSLGHTITRPIQRRMMHAYPNIELQKLFEEKRRAVLEQRTGEIFVFGYGCSFYKLASLFVIGSVLGDLAETVYCYVRGGVLMSRSSLVYGPFSIVWGFGCVMLTVALYRYRDRSDRLIFLTGTILGGAYEYFCSVLSELVFGTVFWDYSEMAFNLGGRINLLYCFFWGIVAVVWLKAIYPFFSERIEKIPVRPGKICANLVILLLVFDMALSVLALGRYSQRQMEPTKAASAEVSTIADGTGTDNITADGIDSDPDSITANGIDSDITGTGASDTNPDTADTQSIFQMIRREHDGWLARLLDEHFPDEWIETRYQNLQLVQ